MPFYFYAKCNVHSIQWKIFSIIYAEILKITTQSKFEIFIQIARKKTVETARDCYCNNPQ